MKNNNIISVIVCAYNTEKYLEKCLNSILNQTYKNIELIVVNDCSTDHTKQIIEKIALSDKRVKFINNDTNRGLSYSRNIALKNSIGSYIGYIDSDDYIPEDYYESLFNTLKNNDSDIAICDIILLYEETGNTNRVSCGKIDNNKLDFINNGLAASVCNKLFKKEIISMYQFSEGKVNEDLAVTIPLILQFKCSYNDKVSYIYVQRDNSIQNSELSDKRFDIFYGVDLLFSRVKNLNIDKDYLESIIFNQLILLFIYVIPKEKKYFKRRYYLKKFNILSKKYNIRNNIWLKQFLDHEPFKTKIYYKLLFFFNCNGLYLLSSFMIMIMNLYICKIRNSVIKKDINIDDIIKLAKNQINLKENNISVSVIIPNYNYEKYIYDRVYSILSQNYKIKELIILDDASKDNSRELIDDLVKKINKYVKIKTIYNEKNSGSAFIQWQKGFNMATGDYVWIAEADDFCDKNLLNNLIKPILDNDNIMISYSDTAFINANGNIILKSIVPEIDIMKTNHWNNSFINNGIDEYNKYAFLNCTIANVSSCIIKNGNYDEEFKLSSKLKQAGDWLFYVNIMRKGQIAYTNKALNYYRLHGNNVSSTFKYEKHLEEIKFIHKYYRDNYGLSEFQEEKINQRYAFLKKAWNLSEEVEHDKH